MTSSNRYKTIPKRYESLLDQGESPGVDFKQELPKSGLGQLIAAAANTVALEETLDEYIIIVGAEEVETPSGAVVGRPSNLDLGNLDELRLRIVSQVQEKVKPRPKLGFIEFNVAKSPMVAVHVEPSFAPHRFDSRYERRADTRNVAIDASELDELFVKRRAGAAIDEIEGSDSLRETLTMVINELAHLANQNDALIADSFDAAFDLKAQIDQLQHVVEEYGGFHTPNEVQSRVTSELETISSLLENPPYGARLSPLEMIEDSYKLALRQDAASLIRSSWFHRDEAWQELQLHEQIPNPSPLLGVARRVMEEFFTGDVRLEDIVLNQEEVNGWTRPPDHLHGDDPLQNHLTRSVYAAYRRWRGGPLFDNRLRSIRYEPLPAWSPTGEPPPIPKTPLRWQLGLAEVSDLEAVWTELRDVGDHEYIEDRGLLVWRYDRGVFVVARPVAGSLMVAAYEPAFAGSPSKANRRIFPMIKRRLAAVDGKVTRLDAEGAGPLDRITP